MLPLVWLKASGSTRGKPWARPLRGARALALGLLGASTLFLTGCQSGGRLSQCRLFSPCGFLGRATNRVIHPFSRGCGGGGCVGGVDGYASSDVIVEPPAAIYGPPMGTVPSTVVPAEPPTDLSPLPSAKPGPPPSTGSSSSSANPKTGFRPRVGAPRTAARPDRSTERTSTNIPPGPTTRSARASSAASDVSTSGPADGMDWLDHLPPLDLPGEVTRSAEGPSAAAPAAKPAAPGPKPKPELSAPGQLGGLAQPARPLDAEGAGPALASAEAGTFKPAGDSDTSDRSGAPSKFASLQAEADDDIDLAADAHRGIDRFAPVDPSIAGGSAPDSNGLAWLAEKGYRTIVDLRDTPEVSPTFIGEASQHGLRYVALPVTLETIDRARLDRFQFELGLTGARPLYFFDSDGNRAGALWYVRRVAVDKTSARIAEREAEDVGLAAPAARLAAVRCVENLGPPHAGPVSLQFRPDDPALPPRAPTLGTAHPLDATRPNGSRAASAEAIAGPLADGRSMFESVPTIGDPVALESEEADGDRSPAPPIAPHRDTSGPDRPAVAWRPLAAVALTGLTIPLAYWTSAGVPTLLAKARASLPGPAPRSRSLPRASDD